MGDLHLGLLGRVSGGDGDRRYCWMRSLILVVPFDLFKWYCWCSDGIQEVLFSFNLFSLISIFISDVFRFWASQLPLHLFHLTRPLHHPLLQKASLRWRWRLNWALFFSSLSSDGTELFSRHHHLFNHNLRLLSRTWRWSLPSSSCPCLPRDPCSTTVRQRLWKFF